MMVSEQEKRELSRGYLRVPVSLIGVFSLMVIQTGGGIWWAATVTEKLETLSKAQLKLTSIVENNTKDRYTGTDASVARREFMNIIDDVKADIKDLDKRVTNFQSRHSALLEKLHERRR